MVKSQKINGTTVKYVPSKFKRTTFIQTENNDLGGRTVIRNYPDFMYTIGKVTAKFIVTLKNK